jgi:crystallin, alpha B
LRRNDLLSSLANTHIATPSRTSPYYRPWSHNLARQDSGSTVNVEKDKFQIILDVQQFTPEEITVKTNDKFIIVEGKHEEKQDEHGFVSR